MAQNRVIAAVAVVIVFVLVLGSYLLTREGDRTASTTTTADAIVVTSPYDLSEADGDIDLDLVRDAKFASVLLETPDGLTSYMVAAEEPPFEALAEAVAKADKTDEPAPTSGSTLAFVMPDRVTVTFVIDLEKDLIARDDQTWRPKGDIAALIAAVTDRATAGSE